MLCAINQQNQFTIILRLYLNHIWNHLIKGKFCFINLPITYCQLGKYIILVQVVVVADS